MDRTANKINQISNDRVIVLAPMPGKTARAVSGQVDSRLFNGENRLHALRDPQTGLWSLRYDHGITQQSLQQRFTTWQKIYDFTKTYFGRRDIEIKEIIDA